MFADNDDDAWTALRSWRGLRAPSRLQQLDPEALRLEADSFPKEEIMGKFSKASTVDELYEIYKPLVHEFDSEIVTIQISSINQEETIRLLKIQKDMMVKQLIHYPDLYYAKSHFPLEISQRAFDHLWRMCESYELWCKETKQNKLIKLNIID